MSTAKNTAIDGATGLIDSQATRNQGLKRRSLCTRMDCDKDHVQKMKSMQCSKKHRLRCYVGQPRPPLVETEQQSASYVWVSTVSRVEDDCNLRIQPS